MASAERVREVCLIADTRRLPYTESVITESMRLYSLEPMALDGFEDITGPFANACTAEPVDLKTYATEKCPAPVTDALPD
ncbi:hypothetical protein DB346_22750 [Verrucomicrobia bacterium LW23]|nr:hypothetical protein DB346_22750 [Verrucomicrobia bacterium LW23]